jgi:hypothetical protein
MKQPLHKNVEVKRGAYGLGLFAIGPIKRDAVVAEYWGEILTEEEANRRGGKYL